MFHVDHTIQCAKYFYYHLSPGNHYVSGNSSLTSFSSYAVLYIEGQNSTITCTDAASGWKFADISTDVFIENVTFENCHSMHPSNTRRNGTTNAAQNFEVALYFVNCQSVHLIGAKVTFTILPLAVCVFLHNPGHANITSSSFANGINGIILELTDCRVPCIPQLPNHHYTFEKCNFTNNNSSSKSHVGSTAIPRGQDFDEYNKGGGILIVVKGDTFSNEIRIINCLFSQNQAQYGGGVFVSFLDQTHNNYFLVSGSNFLGNECPFSNETKTFGGGIYIESLATRLQQNFLLEMNSFDKNNAFAGGAVYITLLNSTQSSLFVTDTNFNNNSARFASAIYIDQAKQFQGNVEALVLSRDVFQNNFIDYPRDKGIIATTGLGTVFSKDINIQFRECVRFDSNKGTALVMVDAVANFANYSSSTMFVGNIGTRGGAIALLGDSYMLVNSIGMNMTFQNNSATFEGGAIYKHYPDSYGRYGSKCFVEYWQHNNEDGLALRPSTFNFRNNRVLKFNGPRSNSIHVTSIEPCMISGAHNGNPLCWDNWNYDGDTQCNNNISNHVTTDFNAAHSLIMDASSSVSPGWSLKVPFVLQDDLGSDIINYNTSSFVLSLDGETASLSSEDDMRIYAGTNETIQVEFESLQGRSMHFELEINTTACPPGFVYNNKSKNCTCPPDESDRDFHGLICYEEYRVATLLNDVWIGFVDDNYSYYLGTCPVHFCMLPKSKLRMLPSSANNLSHSLCQGSRSGVLCGECQQDSCLAVNSWAMECVEHETKADSTGSNIILYIATVYLPFFIMLSLLAVCHIKLMAGPMHAFVLFSQMIVTSFDLTEHDRIPLDKNPMQHFPNVYRFVYGPFNLDFLEKHIKKKVCFSSEFNALSVLVLDYLLLLVPAFIVVIAAICIGILKRVKREQILIHQENVKKRLQKFKFIRIIQKKLSETVVLSLSTLALLSYTKLSIASAMILYTSKLHSIDSKESSRRVFIAGQFSSDDPRYTFYKVAASFGEVYLLFLILLLLDFPLKLTKLLICKINALRRFKFIGVTVRAIESFAYAFQESFRPNFRFFAGFYFIFRYTISLVHLKNNSSILKYLVQELTCIAMILLLVICKPHKEPIHNVADISIFTNLAVINAINFYQKDVFLLSDKSKTSSRVFFFQCVLALAPVVVLLMCVCWNHTKSHVKHFLKKYVFRNRIIVLNDLIQSATHADIEEGADEDAAVAGEGRPQISNNNASKGRSAKFNEHGPPQSQARKCDGACNFGTLCSGADGVPVTIVDVCDKGMGEALTSQSRLSEGYYLKREWSSAGCNTYGAINS